jgi:hypothetical protein
MHQALVDASRECDGKFWSETEYTDKACGQCSVRRAAWGGCTTAEKYVCRELEFVMAGLLTGVEVQAAAEGACESILVAAATVEAKRVVVELWGAAERLAEEEEAEEVQAALLQVSIRQHTSAYVSIRQHTSAYVCWRRRRPRKSRLLCYRYADVC